MTVYFISFIVSCMSLRYTFSLKRHHSIIIAVVFCDANVSYLICKYHFLFVFPYLDNVINYIFLNATFVSFNVKAIQIRLQKGILSHIKCDWT